MVLYDMVLYGMVWYGMAWYGMVWYGMAWYGMVWYGMVWYGMVRYGILPLSGITGFSSSGKVTYQNFCGMFVTVLSKDILFIVLAKSSFISLERI